MEQRISVRGVGRRQEHCPRRDTMQCATTISSESTGNAAIRHLRRLWINPDGESQSKVTMTNGATAPKGRQSRAVAHKDAVNPRSHPGTGTAMNKRLPDPHLTKIYRLEAILGVPQVLGEISGAHRRIVPLTGGTFSGPELRGELVPGASADWQIILPDGATFGDVRYTLATEHGHLLYVQSRTVRHGSPEVLARLGRGEDVDANEYTFRASTKIETAAAELDWLNKDIFVSVAGRQAGGVIYEVYLVR